MKIKKSHIRIIMIVFAILYILLTLTVNAAFTPTYPTGKSTFFSDKANNIMESAIGVVDTIAKSLLIVIIIYMGIKYVLGAPEGKAEYKKMLLPFAVGAVIIANPRRIISLLQNGNYSDVVVPQVNGILAVVSLVAPIIATIMTIYIGIKYVMASPEGKAEYKKILLPYAVGIIFIYKAPEVLGAIQSANYSGLVGEHVNNIELAFEYAAPIIALIMLLYIGIKYMTSAPEGKAEYKKILIPYVIGAIIIYTTIYANNWLRDTILGVDGRSYVGTTETVLSQIIAVLRYVGVGIAIVMLIVLALKYIMSAPEGKAEFTKTAVPYLIGTILLFAATSILKIIQTFAESI